MADAGVYVGVVLGAVVLLGVSIGIIYYQHRKEVSRIETLRETHARVIQDRMQQVVDQNLPPFYVDHERDPVCVYEHELPPDVIPPEQPILVHSESHHTHPTLPDHHPLVAASPSPLSPHHGNPSSFPFPTMTERPSPVNAESVHNSRASIHSMQQDGSRSLTSPAPAILAPSPSGTASPRMVDQQMLRLARLPAPPSYDVPNRVVDRSPFMHSHHHRHQHHTHSYSTSDVTQLMTPPPPAAAAAAAAPQDYFGPGRARSRTISHTTSDQHVNQVHQNSHSHGQVGGSLPATPRYSLEFPSHIPHHLHLAEYWRARALHDRTPSSSQPSSPASMPLSRIDSNGSTLARPHMLTMQDRSHSDVQPYNHSPFPATLDQQRQRNGQRLRGSRPRASTVGESSKLLVQRMQQLWKRTASPTPQRPLGSGQSSLNVSSLNVAEAVNVGADTVTRSSSSSPQVALYSMRRDSSQRPEQTEGHEDVAIEVHNNDSGNEHSAPSESSSVSDIGSTNSTEVVNLDAISPAEQDENSRWNQIGNHYAASTPPVIMSPLPLRSSASVLLAVS
ncbi:hypothetical protein B0O80DRAFT_489560 [Mortierella sp. GBAus27b]|nr:hypothetical protein B0O80DRAFT_489560 [Mortierella sp. GBAus27b]